jgi:opacity protein-like surface antigen
MRKEFHNATESTNPSGCKCSRGAGLAGGSAFADDASNGGYYLSADGGVSILPNFDLKTAGGTAHEHFDTGYAYGGAAGYDWGDGMRVELDTTHQMSNLSRIGGVSTGGNGHLQSTSVMVNGQLDLTHNTSVTPYVGAGLGAQNVGASVAGLHDTDWKPAYQAEAGVRTDISPKMSLYGEYRFSQSEAADLSDGGVRTSALRRSRFARGPDVSLGRIRRFDLGTWGLVPRRGHPTVRARARAPESA